MTHRTVVLWIGVVSALVGFGVGRYSAPWPGLHQAVAGDDTPVVEAVDPAVLAAQPSACPVLRVVDGDTMEVLYRPPKPMREKIRLLMVNTPERGQPGYRQATQSLRSLVAGHDRVTLAFEIPGQPKRDRYGRLLAYVVVDGLNANIELVRQGWSPYWDRYGSSRFEAAFLQAQRQAQAARRGLWAPPRQPQTQR